MSILKKNFVAIIAVLMLMSAGFSYIAIRNDHPEGYHYFHAIHLDDEAIRVGNTVIQPLVFSKDHDYDFVIKGTTVPIKVEIRDDHNKLVATNYDASIDKFYQNMIFECHISEMYKIIISGENIPDGSEIRIFSKAHYLKI